MGENQKSQNGKSISESEWTVDQEPNTFDQYIQHAGLKLPLEILEAKELMAMYPYWAKEITDAADMIYEED
jgi:hypothetical protein